MADSFEIREGGSCDLVVIKMLYADAFPNEDLLPLVADLLQVDPMPLSLVGTVGSSIIGHVIFTTCGVAGTRFKVALLGPLAVASAWQKQGLGSALVRNGLQRLETIGISHVYVLGDPAYYSRFGFIPEADVKPPYPLPAQWREAWRSIRLGNGETLGRGELSVPQPWLKPELWAP